MFDFKSWLTRAKRGDSMVYYRGQSLAHDRGDDHENNLPKTPAVANARDALDAYESGLVNLVQRRTESGFEYIAQRR